MKNKDEALKMVHTTFMQLNERFPRRDNGDGYFDKEIIACKEALEPTVAELNDEYLRDTHVEGLNKPRIALEKATKAWYDVDLTGQTNLECARNWFIEGYVQALEFPPKAKTQQPTKEEILGKVFDAVYAQYHPKAEPQEPIAWMNDIAFSMDKDELTAEKFGDIIPLYTHPKQWQGLSDEEIWDIANFLGKNKEWDYPVMFAKTIEMHLKEKNT